MTTASTPSKKYRAYRFGLWAEWLCVLWLLCKGYHIIKRRWRVSQGEIDIIARKGSTLVFIEVKARHSHTAAIESLTWHQRQRISRTATVFISGKEEYTQMSGRFDVMLVSPWRWPTHMINAWSIDQ